ncbi:MAG: O-antigen ligase family protein [Solobacterium sp.]|nr:O-antigen ligase family protein [Solobacterium sp.]
MENTVERLKKALHWLVLLLVVIQPVIDMDYLFYEQFQAIGLPRLATIVRFLVLPGLVLLSFVLREPKKKQTFFLALAYGIIFIIYFVLHVRQAEALVERLWLTDNFKFNTWQELTYVLTLIFPYAMVYLGFHEHFTQKELRNVILALSALISIPVVLGDLYVFGRSTYYGDTVGNFFSWFSGIYDWYHPRTLASKFFFNEGNTVGILLFMILPVLYGFFAAAKTAKEKKWIGALIIVQSLAMMMLSTRVATYGAVVVPALFLVLYLINTLILKKDEIRKNICIFCVLAAACFGAVLNWTPAIQNQKVDAKNDVALLHNGAIQFAADDLKNAEDLVPGSEEWINFYVYAFETYGINARYIQSVPSMYYTEYYSYQHDPWFWFHVCYDIPVFDRVNGRQIETIFFNYKYENLTPAEKILGMGYSTFMNGSIVLEKDFAQQVYTLGYAGFVILLMPWIGILLYGAYMVIRYWKKMITLENVSLFIALGAGFGSAWLSGHYLDQFLTMIPTAFIIAILLNRAKEAEHE